MLCAFCPQTIWATSVGSVHFAQNRRRTKCIEHASKKDRSSKRLGLCICQIQCESENRGRELNTTFFSQTCRALPGCPGILVSLGFEGHTELFGPHPFTWKTPTPHEDIRTKTFGFGFFFSCLTKIMRRRTNVQQLRRNIDLSCCFYYLFLSFVLLELKPLVLKGNVLGENSEKLKSVNNSEC